MRKWRENEKKTRTNLWAFKFLFLNARFFSWRAREKKVSEKIQSTFSVVDFNFYFDLKTIWLSLNASYSITFFRFLNKPKKNSLEGMWSAPFSFCGSFFFLPHNKNNDKKNQNSIFFA